MIDIPEIYNTYLNTLRDKNKEKYKEDRKDDRTKIQASQQSELIEQRKKESIGYFKLLLKSIEKYNTLYYFVLLLRGGSLITTQSFF